MKQTSLLVLATLFASVNAGHDNYVYQEVQKEQQERYFELQNREQQMKSEKQTKDAVNDEQEYIKASEDLKPYKKEFHDMIKKSNVMTKKAKLLKFEFQVREEDSVIQYEKEKKQDDMAKIAMDRNKEYNQHQKVEEKRDHGAKQKNQQEHRHKDWVNEAHKHEHRAEIFKEKSKIDERKAKKDGFESQADEIKYKYERNRAAYVYEENIHKTPAGQKAQEAWNKWGQALTSEGQWDAQQNLHYVNGKYCMQLEGNMNLENAYTDNYLAKHYPGLKDGTCSSASYDREVGYPHQHYNQNHVGGSYRITVWQK